MAGYSNIRNSAATANNNYFTAAGAAINASNQPPNNIDTVMAGTLDSALGPHMYGLVSKGFPVAYTGNDRTQIMMGSVNTLKGSASNALRDPGALPPVAISIPQMNTLQTVKVTTAIRAGAWNEISGFFATSGGAKVKPATSNDFSAVGNDNEADSIKSAPGLFTFANSAGSGVRRTYDARTQ